MDQQPNSNNKESSFEFFQIKDKLFVSTESIIKNIEKFIKTIEEAKIDPLESEVMADFRGRIIGLVFFKKFLEDNFFMGNATIELDSMGVGDGSTKFFEIKYKDAKNDI